uniref:AIR synthase related protein n=1 Tax=uncultured Novosphingobium sp. TaxID=292277 RepID=UPI00374A2C54
PRYVYADPYEGGMQAVAETWRNISAVGGRPLAITNCLNFANPQRPEIMAQIVHALHGMGDACRALDYPIVSGNVSLYNESKATGGGSAILPTPAIGGVGLLDDHDQMATIAFKAAGESIVLIGGESGHLGQSLWLREILGREEGPPPPVGLDLEKLAGDTVRGLIGQGMLTAVHDCADGGVAVALAEMALASGIGFAVAAPEDTVSEPGFWFGEDQARYVVTTRDLAGVLEAAEHAGLVAVALGETEGNTLTFRSVGGETSTQIATLREAHEAFFRDWMDA